MNRDELLMVLYANWMDNHYIGNKEIRSFERALMKKIKGLDSKTDNDEYFELEESVNHLSNLYLMEGFKIGFTTAMTFMVK